MIYLVDITAIERTDLKPYCLQLDTKEKRFYLSLKNDEEVYGWQDDIYNRSPLMGVSNPTNFVHKIHVGFDPVSGAFTVSSNRCVGIRPLTARCLRPGPARAMDPPPHTVGYHP